MKITKSELKQIIKEEAARFAKIKALEQEKAIIEKHLNEMYAAEEVDFSSEEQSGEMEEAFLGIKNKFDKAVEEYKAAHANDIKALTDAYNNKDISYIDLSQKLKNTAGREATQLGQKFGISGSNDLGLLLKSIQAVIEPMNHETFKRQVEQGVGLKDLAAGASGSIKTTRNENATMSESQIRKIVNEEAERQNKVKELKAKADKIKNELKNL